MASNEPTPTTVAACLRHAARALGTAGVEDAPAEARRLLAAALGFSAVELVSRAQETLPAEHIARIESFLARRCAHEPLSRIVGAREFYGRTFKVTPATLDPRADSETLIEAVLELMPAERREQPLRILDIGTGTGCLLLTLLAELPFARGVGTDINATTLAVARDNGERLGLGDRVMWTCTNVAEGLEGSFDLLISNPPYIRTADIPGLDPEVRNHDPVIALDGGGDGLLFYRKIAQALGDLVPDGWAVLEVGYDQADAVIGLLSAPQSDECTEIRTFHDVAGRRRVVAARSRSPSQVQKGLGISSGPR